MVFIQQKNLKLIQKVSQLKAFTGHFFYIFKEALRYIEQAKKQMGESERGKLNRQSLSFEITMDRFRNKQTQPWTSGKKKKGALYELSCGSATSNNALIAVLKILCEKQKKRVKDEKLW